MHFHVLSRRSDNMGRRFSLLARMRVEGPGQGRWKGATELIL